MSRTAWPTAAEVVAALGALPTPIVLPDAFDVQGLVDSAVAEWNRRTRYRPFFSPDDASDVALPFDPPGPDVRATIRGGGYRLQFGNGLISLTSLFVGVNESTDDPGQELTSGLEFYLGPSNAPSLGEPYTYAEFVNVRRGMPRSIVVTGRWGYCAGIIPEDAWQGVMNLTLGGVLQRYREGLATGLIEVKVDDVSKRRSIELIGRMGDGLLAKGNKALNLFRLLY